MKVSVIQLDIVFNNPLENEKKVEAWIEQAMQEQPDCILLPEMWNVSFFPENVEESADVEGERTKNLLQRLSKQHHVNIVGGSVATLKQGKLHNTAYIFNREGEQVGEYDKAHLFSPSGENEVFTAGNKLGTFVLDGVKMGMVTCYDLRFGEWIRMLALEGIEVLFLPAAWPHPRVNHWRTLSAARAIENQFYVVSANSVGKANDLSFCGHSSIFSPLGEVIQAMEEEEGILTGELDLSVTKGIREGINVFRDRRPDLYQLD